jgi:RND family efflux transporter MFP subunit
MTTTTAMRLLFTITVAASLAATACGGEAPESVESEAVVPVKAVPSTTGSIRGVIHATGVVTPAPGAELVVVAPEAARIAAIPHGEGERVRRGDVLVRFEIPTLPAEVERQAAEVQRAEASLANAKANQTRAHDLFERGVAARKEVEDADRALADAEAAVAQAQASQGAARATAARSVVRASFDGVIAKRYHNPGDFVEASASDPVLRVIDLNRLEVVASVPLADASRVMVGAAARLTSSPAARLAPSPAAPQAATLTVVSRPAAVDPGSASVPVRLAFTTPANEPARMPVQVDIEAEEHTGVVLVPAAALVREGEATAVFAINSGKAERRLVQTGLSDGEQVEIVSGVKAGELVIVEGQAGLPDGASVAVQAAGEPAGQAAPAPAAKDEAK